MRGATIFLQVIAGRISVQQRHVYSKRLLVSMAAHGTISTSHDRRWRSMALDVRCFFLHTVILSSSSDCHVQESSQLMIIRYEMCAEHFMVLEMPRCCRAES